ncbi:MAG: DUF2807 domain-containing protein [Bacteroides sp.]|nr:DUF2807 domain-containing protein [Bacteroides sp.]MCM1413330.1 DUF2807 domain-containing protein [Bacteroides sp.]MCM1471984.1 DUF2807 domain-containing protein [Bacteroides sp.]
MALMSVGCVRTGDFSGISDVRSTGPVITQQRNVTEVTALDVSRGVRVEVVQAATPRLTVEAPDDVMDLITTTVNGSELKISSTRNLGQVSQKVKVTVAMPAIVDFEISSGSSVTISGAYDIDGLKSEIDVSSGAAFNSNGFNVGFLEVDCSSGAACNISGITASQVEADAASGAAITLAGQSAVVDFDAASGGVCNASSLKADKGSASASSGGAVSSNIASPSISHSSDGSVQNRQ